MCHPTGAPGPLQGAGQGDEQPIGVDGAEEGTVMIDEYAIDARSFSQTRHDQRRDDEGLPPDS